MYIFLYSLSINAYILFRVVLQTLALAGTWVAHPALVKVALAIFDKHMPTPNQIKTNPGLEGASVTESNLLKLPSTIPRLEAITSKGLIKGVAIVLAYTEAWLRGIGCIPLNNAMEDAATAEISRAQIWQWRYHGVRTGDDGAKVTSERIKSIVAEEVKRQSGEGNRGKWLLAGKLVSKCIEYEINVRFSSV
mmetsp:Transcript_15811/g.23141  ORF Transcript_15811/g.23141 Transcript_15811/m.23141 type:complete len:192 (+) Transcript_15811:785-1360(+)